MIGTILAHHICAGRDLSPDARQEVSAACELLEAELVAARKRAERAERIADDAETAVRNLRALLTENGIIEGAK